MNMQFNNLAENMSSKLVYHLTYIDLKKAAPARNTEKRHQRQLIGFAAKFLAVAKAN